MAGEYKKLYPPVIEGTLPAFYGTELSVPFSMNRAVSDTEVYGFIIKVKNVYNNTNIREFKCKLDPTEEMPAAAVFDIAEAEADFNIGEYYKIQMAYLWKNPADIDNDEYVGYYSTVGVIKYTTKPTITIANMNEDEINAYNYTYMGVYSQEGKDTTERVYKYKFDLLDNYYQLIATSDWQLHNITRDDIIYESTNIYQFNVELETNKTYYVVYSVETTNKMIVSSPRYKVAQNLSINPEILAHLVPTMNKDNGYIDLKLQGEINPNTKIEEAVTGTFKVVRASSLDNFSTWNEVLKFSLYGQQPSRQLWKDFTVQQGVTYRYALQQYNEQLLTSNRIESVDIVADFEDMFLYDGQRQLKIRFNPKVTSFKNTLLESKVDTIGSKYPFIFRNGNVKYKEFPLSGLISYHADEEKLFMNYELETIDTNLTSENIAIERDFKLEVLEWLTNGKPKLFRSPTEGNYIVRLLNTSLAPTDAVGRMLHTFSATAYEIDECNYQTLNNYGFIQLIDQPMQQIRWESISLNEDRNNLLDYAAIGLDIQGAIPGELIYIDDGINRGDAGMHSMMPEGRTTGYIVSIGPTGNYRIDIDNNIKITYVGLVAIFNRDDDYSRLVTHSGNLTYAYYSKLINSFDLISSISAEEITLQQFTGKDSNGSSMIDIIQSINDIKNEIQKFYYLKFYPREIEKIYRKMEAGSFPKYYKALSDDTPLIDLNDLIIYEVYDKDNADVQPFYMDGRTKTVISNINYWVNIDHGDPISFEDVQQYTIHDIDKIKSLEIGSGIIAECSYQKQIKEYSIESQDEELLLYRYGGTTLNTLGRSEPVKGYEQLKEDIYNLIYTPKEYNRTALEQYIIELETLQTAYEESYKRYIELLNKKLEEKEGVQGDEV